MNESKIKEILLFLLKTAKNQESRLFDNQMLANALVEQHGQSVLVVDRYHSKLAQAARENNGRGIPDYQGFDQLIDEVLQWKVNDDK